MGISDGALTFAIKEARRAVVRGQLQKNSYKKLQNGNKCKSPDLPAKSYKVVTI